MLYMKDKPCALFRDCGEKYRPVNLYLGAKKIAGYEYAKPSGEHLSVDNTYNDSAYIEVEGKTVEVGSGDKAPDNPYELVSVGDFGIISTGKNVWNAENIPANQIVKEVAITRENNIITFDGKNTTGTNAPGNSADFYLVPGTINITIGKLSGAIVTGGVRFYLYKVGPPITLIKACVLESGTEKSEKIVLTETGKYRLAPFIGTGNHFNNCKTRAQIEYSDTGNTYAPFKGLSSVHFDGELRSLPDGTCDRLIIDNKQKKAWMERNIERIVLDGSENYSLYTDYPIAGWGKFLLAGLPTAKFADLIVSSHFRYYVPWDYTNTVKRETLNFTSTRTQIIFKTSVATTVNVFKSWIFSQYSQGTPVKIEYQLATPIETQLDYETVKTFYPYTQIYTTSVVQPTIEAKIRVLGA